MSGATRRLRVGVAGLGLDAYWSQFAGLEQRLIGYLRELERKIAGEQRTIVRLGMVDTPEKSVAAGHLCRTEDLDLLLLYVTTYALSSTALPIIKRAKLPVILLNLQPAAAIDYERFNAMDDRTAMTGEWLAYCSSCPVPEIANVLRRLEIPFHQVTGMLHNDPVCWAELEAWLRAAEAVNSLAHCRLGLMGHYYGGMLDIATDLTQVSGRFDLHIEMLELDELTALRRGLPEDTVDARVRAFREFFEVGDDCSLMELARASTK